MSYLIAAYASIWVVLAFFIFVLLKRNRDLSQQVEELEARLTDLEEQGGS
ncbi:MAG: CcmD family protein [Acidobacteriota bacterium]|nr:CcmD family protein [Acidobacteriota bacterium]